MAAANLHSGRSDMTRPVGVPEDRDSDRSGMTAEYPVKTVRKLIEVALPLDDINRAAAREKSIRHGHPSTLHLWWARRPLAAARAVLFAQLVDDPSSRPECFPTKERQDRERNRLFAILRELVRWENTTNEELLEGAREEVRKSWRRTCADNADHPRASELFDPERLPAFHDPFAGGGAIPLEAQRLGLEAHASDLNPVAVLINKAMIEIPPKFAGRPPVNPESRKRALGSRKWKGAAGLAEDVRYYGQWMRDEAERRIGHLYPKVRITPEMVVERPDLERYAGRELTVIAWLWARTVRSPNPAFAEVEVPLVSNFMLSTKKGKEAWVEPVVEGRGYRFKVGVGPPPDVEAARRGTKIGRGASFRCVVSETPMAPGYIKAESMAGRMGSRLMAIVAEGDRERLYLSPLAEHERIARSAEPSWRPDEAMNRDTTNLVSGRGYGFFTWADLFTERQLASLTTFSDLVAEARAKAHQDAVSVENGRHTHTHTHSLSLSLSAGGTGPAAYAAGIAMYLAIASSRAADAWSTVASWRNSVEATRSTFARQALPMVWDYAEANPFSVSCGNWIGACLEWVSKALLNLPDQGSGFVYQADATTQILSEDRVVSTDPPYYDNIGYADLSDFFYVWMRRVIRPMYPEIVATLAVPKAEELVATPHRHGGREEAETFFLRGMSKAMARLVEQTHASLPVTIYYAFKQTEASDETGTASTGWETFLDGLIRAGFITTGTWPMRTERGGRSISIGANALASSIVLVCRRRPSDAVPAGRTEFIQALKKELPPALLELQKAGIAPVDLAQAAIGPGMAVFTRYRSVNHVGGEPLTVREALALINLVLDETLEEQEGDFDSDTRWAVAWFTQHHFEEGEFGDAETLSKAKNTSVAGLVEAGILQSGAGRVRLLRPEELPEDWDPAKDRRLTVWEMVHHLIRVLEDRGETGAARLLRRIGGKTEEARALAHRLYAVCERQKRPAEARAYNALVGSWAEIARLAREDRGEERALFAG